MNRNIPPHQQSRQVSPRGYSQDPYPPHPDAYPAQPPRQRSAGHHGGYAPPPPPQKRRRVWPWVLLGIFVAPILGFVACTAMVGGAVSAASGPATIRYELTGEGSANAITWSQDGGTGQETSGSLPWSKSVNFADAFLAPVTVTAQLADGGGSISCRIVNETTGEVIAESSSSGRFAVVSCMGTANGQ